MDSESGGGGLLDLLVLARSYLPAGEIWNGVAWGAVVAAAILLWQHATAPDPVVIRPPPPPPPPRRDYTLRELRQHDGRQWERSNGSGGCGGVSAAQLRQNRRAHAHIPQPQILVALNRDIYDVTHRGQDFYGIGAPYELFAGRDATRAMALNSLERGDLDAGAASGRGLEDLGWCERDALDSWVQTFAWKYDVVGRLVAAHAWSAAAHARGAGGGGQGGADERMRATVRTLLLLARRRRGGSGSGGGEANVFGKLAHPLLLRILGMLPLREADEGGDGGGAQHGEGGGEEEEEEAEEEEEEEEEVE